MKFSIHELTAAEMQTCMAALAGTRGINTAPPVASTGDDDDNGPANATAPNVDATGLPWDERIHAKSKALTGDGKWRARRGVDDATVASVTAELRSRAPQGAAAMPTPPMPLPVAGAPLAMPTPPMPLPTPTAPDAPNFIPPPPVAAPAAPAAPVASAGPLDFPAFMNTISSLLQTGKVDAPYLADLTSRINTAAGTAFVAITDLNTRPDLLDWVVSVMRSEGRA